MGAGVAGVADLSGDGKPDLVVGAPYDEPEGLDQLSSGAVYLYASQNEGFAAQPTQILKQFPGHGNSDLLGWAASVAAAMFAPEQTASVGYLGSSVFLAFAWLFPEFRLYLMFVLPVPIKYLAWITWLVYGINLVSGTLIDQLLVVAATLNFAVFFGGDIALKLRAGRRRQHQRKQAAVAEMTPFHTCSH